MRAEEELAVLARVLVLSVTVDPPSLLPDAD